MGLPSTGLEGAHCSPLVLPYLAGHPQTVGDITYSIVRPTAFFKSLAGQVGAGARLEWACAAEA